MSVALKICSEYSSSTAACAIAIKRMIGDNCAIRILLCKLPTTCEICSTPPPLALSHGQLGTCALYLHKSGAHIRNRMNNFPSCLSASIWGPLHNHPPTQTHSRARSFDVNLTTVVPWSRSNWSHTDLYRLKKGKVSAQVRVNFVRGLAKLDFVGVGYGVPSLPKSPQAPDVCNLIQLNLTPPSQPKHTLRRLRRRHR